MSPFLCRSRLRCRPGHHAGRQGRRAMAGSDKAAANRTARPGSCPAGRDRRRRPNRLDRSADHPCVGGGWGIALHPSACARGSRPRTARGQARRGGPAGLRRGGHARPSGCSWSHSSATDLIVLVEVRDRVLNHTGHLTFVAAGHGTRWLRITIDAGNHEVQQAAWLAHELQHALEVGGAPEVRDVEALRAAVRAHRHEPAATASSRPTRRSAVGKQALRETYSR